MADIKISIDELDNPVIDEIINLEKSLQHTEGEFVENVKTPFYMNPTFYYGVAGTIAAVLVWAIFEPFINEGEERASAAVTFLLFGSVAGMIGLWIGVVYGISNRNLKQSLYCGTVGLGVSLCGGLLATILAGIAFQVSVIVAVLFVRRAGGDLNAPVRGMAFFVLMCGRSLAWCLASIAAGLGLGVALKSRKMVLNGLAGGMVGGTLGGLLFDPICRFVKGEDTGEATLSRCIALSCIGLFVGIFTGFFENISKDAWFLMLKGPLTGKQFIIFKSPMVIGSAPKCDIYLFKDAAIEPRHAVVTKSGNKYIITDEGGGSGTLVNGRKVDKYVLQPGDVITIGETVLKYNEREKR